MGGEALVCLSSPCYKTEDSELRGYAHRLLSGAWLGSLDPVWDLSVKRSKEWCLSHVFCGDPGDRCCSAEQGGTVALLLGSAARAEDAAHVYQDCCW